MIETGGPKTPLIPFGYTDKIIGQANLPSVHRVRVGDAKSTTLPAEPGSSLLRRLAEQSGSTTLPAEALDELKRLLPAGSGKVVGVIILTDDSHSMGTSKPKSTTRPGTQ